VLHCVGCSVLHCVALCGILDRGRRVVITHQETQLMILLQCVAVCCSVLQCVTVCCSVLQCVAVSNHTLRDAIDSWG